MAMLDKAVLRAAKNVNVGDTLCFSFEAYNFVVADIDIKGGLFVRVIFKNADDTMSHTYALDDRVYVLQAQEK